jgi:hypothetical protein
VDTITLAVPGGSATASHAAPAASGKDAGSPSSFESALERANSGRTSEPDEKPPLGAGAVRPSLRAGTRPVRAGAQRAPTESAPVGPEPPASSPTREDAGIAGEPPAGESPEEAPADSIAGPQLVDANVTQPAPLVAAPPVPLVAVQPAPLLPPPDGVSRADARGPVVVGSDLAEVGPGPTDAAAVAPRQPPGALVRGAAHDADGSVGPRALGVRTGVAAAINPASLPEPPDAGAGLPEIAEPPGDAQRRPTDGSASEEVSVASPLRSKVVSAFPAGRAYQPAARTVDADAWSGQNVAAAAADTGRWTDVLQPADAASASIRQAHAVGVSAHAAAVLRSFGVSTPQPEPGSPTAPGHGVSSISDVTNGVAIEFAAATTDEGHREALAEGGDAKQWIADTARRPAAAGSPSQAPALFSVPDFSAAQPPGRAAEPATATSGIQQAQAPPITDQVVKAVALAWRGGVGEARIRLNPDHLGEVVVSLTVEQGHVRAQVHAETATARAWIEAHQQDLRDGLSGQGLTLERLVVTTDGQRRQPQDDGARRQQRKSGRARAGEDVPRFELTA